MNSVNPKPAFLRLFQTFQFPIFNLFDRNMIQQLDYQIAFMIIHWQIVRQLDV